MRAKRLFTLLQTTVESVIPSILLLATALLICLDVFMRYVLSHPITGAGEIVITLLVWQVMLGSAGVARDRGHIAVDALTSRFSGVARAWIDAVRMLITVAAVAFLAYFGAQLFYQTSGRMVAMLGISRLHDRCRSDRSAPDAHLLLTRLASCTSGYPLRKLHPARYPSSRQRR